MTTTKKLQRIKSRCEELLSLAAQRTPGKWRTGGTGTLLMKNEWGIGSLSSHEYVEQDCPIIPEDEQCANAAYIASCAGSAEAGWKATIATIDFLERNPPSLGLTRSEIKMVKAIIAAWPDETLT